MRYLKDPGGYELIDEDQRRVWSDLHNEGRVMNEKQRLRALRCMAGVIDTLRDTRTLERAERESEGGCEGPGDGPGV